MKSGQLQPILRILILTGFRNFTAKYSVHISKQKSDNNKEIIYRETICLIRVFV